MKTIALSVIMFLPVLLQAQKIGDNQITITLSDTTNIYRQVKIAMVKTDFIVKDDYNMDTLTTYGREFTSMAGNCVCIAIINGNKVVLNGYYSLKKMDVMGFTFDSDEYQKMMFYKTSKTWGLIQRIADRLSGTKVYSKEL